MESLSCLSHEERTARLQLRTKESEIAVKQLHVCIEVIRQKSREQCMASEPSAEAQQLAMENQQLRQEVEKLKQKLISLELLNGMDQVPLPSAIHTTPPLCPEKSPPLPASEPKGPPPPPTIAGEGDQDKLPQQEKAPKESRERSKKGQAQAAKTSTVIDVSRLDFRIGLITTAKKHPEADTLYVEEVELGEERPRCVCSGLVKHIPLEQMQNRLVVMLCNLKPAKMRGILSEAMVMCASSPEKIEIIDPPAGVVPGDRVTVEGYAGTPDALLNPKKKIFEQVQPDLRTNDDCVACYCNIPFTVAGKGVCTVPSLKNCIIK